MASLLLTAPAIGQEQIRKGSANVAEAMVATGQPQRIIVTFVDDTSAKLLTELQTIEPGSQEEVRKLIELRQLYVSQKERAALVNIHGVILIRDYNNLPIAAYSVANADALDAIVSNVLVKTVHLVKEYDKMLAQSLPLIGQPIAEEFGMKGAGTAVVVLDTGVDYTRTDFGSCTSPGEPQSCRVVVAKDFAPDDGQLDDDLHGTNVSAIILGVAPETHLIVFDIFYSTANGQKTDDVIAIQALDWVLGNYSQYNIVAVNMSFGAGLFEAPCGNSAYAAVFRDLRTLRILPVTSSGNTASPGKMADPACAPGAFSVGAVYDANVGSRTYPTAHCTDAATSADMIACFSNGSRSLSLLAPGAIISAAGIDESGTSQAAPHVSGAVAVLRSVSPGLSVPQTETLLKQSKVKITDSRNGVTTSRLNLPDSLFSFIPGDLVFEKPAYNVPGNSNTVTLTVLLELGSRGNVTVKFQTFDASAHQGADYVSTEGTLTWADGDTSPKLITVPLLHSNTNDCGLSFTIRLSTTTGGSISTRSAVAVSIAPFDEGGLVLVQRDPNWTGPPREDQKMVFIQHLLATPSELLVGGRFRLTSYWLGSDGEAGINYLGFTDSPPHFGSGMGNGQVGKITASPDWKHAYIASGFTWPVVGDLTGHGSITLHPRPVPPPITGCFSSIEISPDGQFGYASDPCNNRIGLFRRNPASGDLSLLTWYTGGQNGMPAHLSLTWLDMSSDGQTLIGTDPSDTNAILVFSRGCPGRC